MKHQALQLIDQLQSRERDFVGRPFLAPRVGSGPVRVHLGGAICAVRIEPSDFIGWGVFEPVTWNEAILLREATSSERRAYLQLLTRVRLIISHQEQRCCFGMLANVAARSVALDRVVPIQLAEEVQPFDTVLVRFDGAQHWFEELDLRAELAAADYLRESLTAMIAPEALHRRGLSRQQRAVYAWNYHRRTPQPDVDRRSKAVARNDQAAGCGWSATDDVEHRLQESLNHAGAQLVAYRERGDVYQVTYRANGQRYSSVVRKDDLTVASAGVCLDGQDANFDLTSLVGVLAEGERQHAIYRM